MMQQVLQPVMSDLTSLRGDVTNLSETISQQQETMKSLNEAMKSLNETVRSLSGDLEEHKNRTTSKISDLQTSLQSSIDNPPTGDISRAVLLTLLPYLNNIEENLFTDLSSLINHRATSTDESVSSVRGDLELYKNWTVSELTHLQTSLQPISDTVTTIDVSVSGFRENFMEHKNWTKSELATIQSNLPRIILLTLLPYLNDIEQNLFTDLRSLINHRATSIDESVSSLSGVLEVYKNWTMSELAHLQTSLRPISDRVTTIDVSVSSFREDFKEYRNRTKSELAHLQTSLQLFITTTHSEQLTLLSNKLHYIYLKLDSLNAHTGQNFSSLQYEIYAMVNPLNSKLTSVDVTSTLMRDDLSCVKTDLRSLNDSMNRVCDKVEEHEDHMTAELMELNEYLKENLTHQISSNDNLGVHTCGGTGGWRRAVYLNMSNTSTKCPSGWNMTGYSKRTCGRLNGRLHTCDSITFPVSGGKYSQMCGRIKAYQWGLTSGFIGYRYGYDTIDEAYFSGVSIMHGYPRQHIWTFAAGGWENFTQDTEYMCPCDSRHIYSEVIPPFIGEDYFCESGFTRKNDYNNGSYSFHGDTLWDGNGCSYSSTCCLQHDPPYFTKSLSMPTNDDIELRLCGYREASYENIAVELIELYVKDNYLHTLVTEFSQYVDKSFTHQINTINNLGVHTCGGTGGWRRAVYLDMTDPSMDCPSGWRETGYVKRTCGRAGDGSRTCDSATFPVSGGEYSQVCGRINGYAWGLSQGFNGYSRGYNTTDRAYFSGVAVMHGRPREHIWTFAAGIFQNYYSTSSSLCPCDSESPIPIPPFVGDDYFCESGYTYPIYYRQLYSLDPYSVLWDGKGCHHSSTCCSHNNPPFFTKVLNVSTTDDIELRMCNAYGIRDENIAVELIDLYVK